jgi:hypothetical protein
MFRAAHRSSSGALNVFPVSGLHTHVVTGRSQVLSSHSGEISNKMQSCNRIYYSTVHLRLNMFRVAHRSSSEALTVFGVSGLHTHVVTIVVGTQPWLRPPLRPDYGRHSALTTAATQTWLRPPLSIDYGRHSVLTTVATQSWLRPPLRLGYGRHSDLTTAGHCMRR